MVGLCCRQTLGDAGDEQHGEGDPAILYLPRDDTPGQWGHAALAREDGDADRLHISGENDKHDNEREKEEDE